MARQLFYLLIFIHLFLLLPEAKAVSVLNECLNGICDFRPSFPSSGNLTNIPVRLGSDGMGRFTNAEVVSIFNQEVTSRWNGVPESTINLVNQGALPANQDSDNFINILLNSSFVTEVPAAGPSFGYSLMVFDDDGSIFNDLFGFGSENILGIASVLNFNETQIFEGFALFNGLSFQGGEEQNQITRLILLITHELGHMFGLAHLQSGFLSRAMLNVDNNFPIDTKTIPTMFPFDLVNPDPAASLHRDDRSTAGFLYPASNFASNTGVITGSVNVAGSAFNGSNVIAYKKDDPENENVTTTTEGFASKTNNSDFGGFKLAGLSPGTYIIKFEPIFTNGIGPVFEEGPFGFYQGPGQSLLATNNLSDALENAFEIQVAAGETVSDINIDITPSFNFEEIFREFIDLRIFKARNARVRFEFQRPENPPTFVKFLLPEEVDDLISFRRNRDTFRLRKRRRNANLRLRVESLFEFDRVFSDGAFGVYSVPIIIVDEETGYGSIANQLQFF